MQYAHIRNIEKYHLGYKDRELKWAKVYFNIVQGDPDFEIIDNEIDKWRFISFLLLELQAQKPIPLDERYLKNKGFNLKTRPISLTLQMLHNFINIVTDDSKLCAVEKEKEEEKEEDKELEKDKEEKEEPASAEPVDSKQKHKNGEFNNVFLTESERIKLDEKLGAETSAACIEFLSRYIERKGYEAKSHYLCILDWVINAVKEKSRASPGKSNEELAVEMAERQRNMKGIFDTEAVYDGSGQSKL